MSGVFRNIDPPPPSPPDEYVPPAFGAGGGHTRWVERGWGSIVRKTPDSALYSIYVSTLWAEEYKKLLTEQYVMVSSIICSYLLKTISSFCLRGLSKQVGYYKSGSFHIQRIRRHNFASELV
jgi:hypothetical protein